MKHTPEITKIERVLKKCQVCDEEKYQRVKHLEKVMLLLLESSKNVMHYLAFMASTYNKKYPFRPSPEGEQRLRNLQHAIAAAEGTTE